MPRQHFDTVSTDDVTSDPPVFTIGKEEFTCLGMRPASAIVSLGSATTGEEIAGFIKACLLDENDVGRFTRVLGSREQIVGDETMVDIFNWLAGVYADRPTGRPSASRTGQRKTSRTSEADSSEKVLDALGT